MYIYIYIYIYIQIYRVYPYIPTDFSLRHPLSVARQEAEAKGNITILARAVP